ncbi:feruloyl esteras-like protein B precursor [Amylocarpus encephaloides]|uniref:Carboxylic ester hydrolase n=1 Tax=Amylocarpus encephaloides TaxID=45428 RepID=A0A9P7YJY6_9HELO|nr:feruloyl esteras-like protein B precursor [Amylocarpus encephaloides]
MGMFSSTALMAIGIVSIGATAYPSLDDVCTTAKVQAALPAEGLFPGVGFDSASVTANSITNSSISSAAFFPDGIIDFCNIAVIYSHIGRNDSVTLAYWLPAPSAFQNRFLTTGGGGYAINSGITASGPRPASLAGGTLYGAVSGATDGGFGSFSTNFDRVFNAAGNGTSNYEALFMFGYQAIHELTVFGQEITKNFYSMGDQRLYSYYQGCSEGGREGWNQIQRFGDQFDGAITGAPAFRFSHQQVQHLWQNVVVKQAGYTPTTCELARITRAMIDACDHLDGKVDGVIARSDLCKLTFEYNTTIGLSYSCDAALPSMLSGGHPAESGTVTAEAATIAARSDGGIKDDEGRQVYFSYQPAAGSYADATTSLDPATGQEVFAVNSFGSEFVTRFLQFKNTNNFDSFANGGTDTRTLCKPRTPNFRNAGGKILHFHGEADDSIPIASSVRCHDSVCTIMYPEASYNDSSSSLSEWYKIFVVPGAAHCSINAGQLNGPFPQTNLAVMIQWVEKGVEPVTLNATHLAGSHIGDNAQICAWPLRPQWSGNATAPSCVYDQAGIDLFTYSLDAFPLPVY